MITKNEDQEKITNFEEIKFQFLLFFDFIYKYFQKKG